MHGETVKFTLKSAFILPVLQTSIHLL